MVECRWYVFGDIGSKVKVNRERGGIAASLKIDVEYSLGIA